MRTLLASPDCPVHRVAKTQDWGFYEGQTSSEQEQAPSSHDMVEQEKQTAITQRGELRIATACCPLGAVCSGFRIAGQAMLARRLVFKMPGRRQ